MLFSRDSRLLPLIFLLLLLLGVPLLEASLETSFLTLLVVVLSGAAFLLLSYPQFRLTPTIAVALLILLLLLISQAFSPLFYNSFLQIVTWIAVIWVFTCVVQLSREEKYRRLIVSLILLGGFISAIFSLVPYLQSTTPLPSRYLSGVFYNANWWAGFLLMIFPLAFSLAATSHNVVSRLLYSVVSVVFLVEIFLTRARAAWLGTLVALCILSALFFLRGQGSVKLRLLKFPKSPWFITGTTIVAISLVATFFLSSPTLLFSRAQSLFSVSKPVQTTQGEDVIRYDTGWLHRKSLWKNSLKMVRDYPLFGVGLENFGRYYQEYQDQAWIFATDPHNEYLSFLTEMGLVGLLSFLGLLFFLLWTGRKALMRSPSSPLETESGLLIGVVAVLGAVLVHMLLEHSFGTASGRLYFFTLLGVLASFSNSEKRFPNLGKKVVGIIFGGVILTISISFLWYYAITQFQRGNLALAQNDAEAAGRYFQRSIDINPYQPYVYERLGVNALQGKNPSLAVQFLEKSLSQDPTMPETYGELAIAYYQMGDMENTEKYLLKAINKGPYTTPRYYNALSNFYNEQGEKDKALATYELAYARFPLNEVWRAYQHLYRGMNDEIVELYLSLAAEYQGRGDSQKAEDLVQELQSAFKNVTP